MARKRNRESDLKRYMLIMTNAILAVLLLGSWTLSALGEESSNRSKIPAHTREWTDHNESDPGTTEDSPPALRLREDPAPEPVPTGSVAEDLQKIVVLCATRPQTAEFDRAWTAYLEKHYEPGLNVNRLIEEILARAESYIGFGDGRRGTRPPAARQRNKTRLQMHRIGIRVITRLRLQQSHPITEIPR
jgi:hypothetical protein